MTVRELIEKLSKMDPEAKIEVEGYMVRCEDISVEETFYNRPDNKWVVFSSSASQKPSELVNAEYYLEKMEETARLARLTLRL